MPDFAMLDLGDERYAVSATSGRGHDWMKKWYDDYCPLRGRVLIFNSHHMGGFVASAASEGLRIEGVNLREVI